MWLTADSCSAFSKPFTSNYDFVLFQESECESSQISSQGCYLDNIFQEMFLRTVNRSSCESGYAWEDSLEIGRFRGRGPATCREKRISAPRISNFNTRSNLIALAKYRGSQLKPDHHSLAAPLDDFTPLGGAWCCFRLDCS